LTALAALGYDGDAAAVLAAFCGAFRPWVEVWRRDGFEPVRRAWLDRALGLSGPIEVRLAAESLSGIFTTLDVDGALVLGLAGGETRRILAGDVFLPARSVQDED
jgi:BirA family biotin operon repressor/biotin-[acetyl-CoA-carboxylase] ligase